jgi:hypothetical protein
MSNPFDFDLNVVGWTLVAVIVWLIVWLMIAFAVHEYNEYREKKECIKQVRKKQ